MTTNRSDEELAMRESVAAKLRKKHPSGRIIHELTMARSSTQERADLACVTKDKIVLVEIKSSVDTLKRAPAQLTRFAQCAHEVVLAVAPKWHHEPKHIRDLSGTCTSLHLQYSPAEVLARKHGARLWVADDASVTQAETYCYGCRIPWTSQLLCMLWNAELIAVASEHNVCVGKRPTHGQLVQDLHDMLTGREVVHAVCHQLRRRSFPVADPPVGSAELTKHREQLELMGAMS